MTYFTGTPGPYHVRPVTNSALYCRVVSDDGKLLAFVNIPHMPNAANAQLLAKSWEMLVLLGRIRETCRLTEDTTLARDIDALIADATGAEGPPSEEEEERDEDEGAWGEEEGRPR